MDHHAHHAHHGMSLHRMAVMATLHCLAGCAIGEVLGLVIGTALHWHNAPTTILAIVLAFAFGFSLSAVPLVRAGMKLRAALSVVVAADTLSIATMELVDNGVMWLVPGAMHAGLGDWLFWVSMTIALAVAFCAAVPVNLYLLRRNKGHALSMQALQDADSQPH